MVLRFTACQSTTSQHRVHEPRTRERLPPGWATEVIGGPIEYDVDVVEDGLGSAQAELVVTVRRSAEGALRLVTAATELEVADAFAVDLDGVCDPPGLTTRVALRHGDDARDGTTATCAIPARCELTPPPEAITGGRGQPRPLLALELFSPGRYSIRSVELTPIDPDTMIAARWTGAAFPRRTNLLRQTRLPCGLQSGWIASRVLTPGCAGEGIRSVDVQGPFGGPVRVLRITTAGGGPFRLTSAPWAVREPDQVHVVSFYARGDFVGSICVQAGQREIARRELAVEGGGLVSGVSWTRVTQTFVPDLATDHYLLVLRGMGLLWVDAFQVERATQPSPFTLAAPVELYVAPLGVEGVVNYGTSAVVRVTAVTADEHLACEVHCRVVSVEGVTRAEVLQIPVHAGEHRHDEATHFREVLWRLPAETWSLRGPYRVEVDARAGNRRLSETVETLVTVVDPPVPQSDRTGVPVLGGHFRWEPSLLRMMGAIGVRAVRLHGPPEELLAWNTLEPLPGQWRFFDSELNAYRDAGFSMLGVLQTVPAWARRGNPSPAHGYFERYILPRRMEDWLTYVRTVVTRYCGLIRDWQIWNEPWGRYWYTDYRKNAQSPADRLVTSSRAAAEYVDLCRQTFRVIKEIDPDLNVIGLDSTYRGAGENWTREVLAFGGQEISDTLAFHAYHSPFFGSLHDPQSYWNDAIRKNVIAPISRDDRSSSKPLWLTEGSPTVGARSEGLYRWTLPARRQDPADALLQADRLVHYLNALFAHGVERAYLYSCDGANGLAAAEPPKWLALLTEDGRLSPQASALAFAIRFFDGYVCTGHRDGEDGWRVWDYRPSPSSRSNVRWNDRRAVITRDEPAPPPRMEAAGAWSVHDPFGNIVTTRTKPRHAVYLAVACECQTARREA